MRLANQGGIRRYCATLGQKREVLQYIYNQDPNPAGVVVSADVPAGVHCGVNAWTSLNRDQKPRPAEYPRSGKFFYILERESVSTHPQYTRWLDHLVAIDRAYFRSVSVYTSVVPPNELGVLVP